MSAIVSLTVHWPDGHQRLFEAPTLAPSGASPWLYSQSWALTGYGYNTAPTHVDWYDGYHFSDNYALDMTPTGGVSCWRQPIYPIWDNMTVYAISSGTGAA